MFEHEVGSVMHAYDSRSNVEEDGSSINRMNQASSVYTHEFKEQQEQQNKKLRKGINELANWIADGHDKIIQGLNNDLEVVIKRGNGRRNAIEEDEDTEQEERTIK
ncbi:hypothetical protein RIR_jg32156.t1 [Rhizophagus irregularis DAOM 181602=DAOM 197198]|nr:hypothetical protein RIR_jg32156.t1 [Rhizophagus irregularis DAOM 181602=DAOM 197198]